MIFSCAGGASDKTFRISSKTPGRGGDKKEHVTVDYKKADGSHVTTKHIYV